MQTTLAICFLAVVLGQHQTGAADLGRRFGRQLVQENRIGDGAGAILDAAGANGAGNAVAQISDADDGDLTNDLAQSGQDVGQLMLDTLPTAGSAVPGRRRLHQNAGTGAGCDAIFSDADTSSGEGIENAEDNVAGDINAAKPAGAGKRRLHQNAGTGAGCDAIFSDFDTSTGEATENAEDNIAGDISGTKPAAGGATGRKLLQENRIGDGAGAILDAAGANGAGNAVAQISDADDGDLTNDLAQSGQDVGQLMLDTLPTAGNAVPGK